MANVSNLLEEMKLEPTDNITNIVNSIKTESGILGNFNSTTYKIIENTM